ncbi:hypothetical protein FCM35_KLT00521 [Carex littledalei]|uniref:Uncharacterized protein n=1 Tax=Carex littledalei TaxID=544730 RepID=A0A833RL48_9POAL|nr:hypothetical protein FCM35_KLT00521 [Carex littledalei]
MEAFENYFKEADLDKDGVSFIKELGLPTEVIMQMKSVGSTSGSRVTPSPAMPQGANGSTSTCEQGNIKHICEKLQVALADAAKYRFELNEEICKRKKAEMDLESLIQKGEESENALFRDLDWSESQLDLLQEGNKKLREERDNAVKEVEASQNIQRRH